MDKELAIKLLKVEIEQERKFTHPCLDMDYFSSLKIFYIVLDEIGVPKRQEENGVCRDWLTETYCQIIDLFDDTNDNDALKRFVDKCFAVAKKYKET